MTAPDPFPAPVVTPERELTAPVSLTLPNGRLNPAAVGFARSPLVDTSGIGGRHGWGRNKRWEYWNVITPTHIMALTISSLGYAAVHEVWIFERATERTWASSCGNNVMWLASVMQMRKRRWLVAGSNFVWRCARSRSELNA